MISNLKKRKFNNRGFSLVEIICAVAIMALVSTTIGGIIVVSARTYRKGVSETSIQQEAQLAANNIGNLIKDACSVQYGESGGNILQDGEPVYEADGVTPKTQIAGTTKLSVITNKNLQYNIEHVIATNTLMYYEVDASGTTSSAQVLAKGVSGFTADTANFKENRTINITLTVKDETTNKEIPMSYTMASRNEVVENMTFVSVSTTTIIFLETNPTLIPGETYQIPIAVIGKENIHIGLEAVATGVDVGAVTYDYVEVSVPVPASQAELISAVDTASVTVRTKDKVAGGTDPLDEKSSNIKIRKVNELNVTHAVKRAPDGTYESADAEYTFYANANGSNLYKDLGASWDLHYKKAQASCWSCELTAGGNVYTYHVEADGTEVYSNKTGMESYVKLIDKKEDIEKPSITFKIMQNMPADFVLEVTATSKHALGNNKAGTQYPVDASGTAIEIFGTDIIKPRETRVNDDLEITLEPNETGDVSLGMLGGLTSDVTFTYTDRSDTTTTASYIAADDKVRIKLGNAEKGCGKATGKENYTFTIGVNVAGVHKTDITVHVRRIDELSIEVIDNFRDRDGNLMAVPTYDFRARINVTNGINDAAMQSATKYLIIENDEKTSSARVPQTLSSKISWELKNTKTDRVLSQGYSICTAGTSASDRGTYTTDTYDKNTSYYTIVNVKPARIEQNASGEWFIKQLPEVDISPRYTSTASGLPDDTRLTVTMEMLHPTGGTYNITSTGYGTAIAEAYIEGVQTMSTPVETIVAEPGQGTNVSTQSDEELVIPIEVSGGAVYKIEAQISGNSSKDTKLSSYSSEGKDNPYMSSTATSGTNKRIWYLGLVIGKDETGSSDTGIINIKLIGKNTSDKQIATADIKVAIRRVNEIELEVADDKSIKDVNKAGNIVTLEAYPTGYGETGVEYFNIQRDAEGNICRWEKAGHGEYKSPYTMKWTMVYNNQEKPLEQWTEYFESVNAPVEDNEKMHNNSITFKLKNALPNGAELRATSLHTLGKIDDIKYNKSGKEYGEKYGFIKISNKFVDPDDPFDDDTIDYLANVKRGQDYSEFPDSHEIDNFWKSGANGTGRHWFFRIREITNPDTGEYGAWTKWRTTKEGGDAKKLNAEETRSLLPDKRYQLQMAYMAIDKNTQTIYWPYDTTLTTGQEGITGFEGYKLGWDTNDTSKKTKFEDYTSTYNIGRAGVVFDINGNSSNVDIKPSNPVTVSWSTTKYYGTLGTADNPIIMSNNDTLQVNMTGTAFEWGHYQGAAKTRVQKLTDSGWELVTLDSAGLDIQHGSQFMRAMVRDKSKIPAGIYRLSMHVIYPGASDWTVWNGDTWQPVYDKLKNMDNLLCGSNGNSGYAYIKIE